MAKAIVTGAAGFIGSHVTDRLVADGHDVLAIDNLSFGRREHVHSRAVFWQVDLATVDDDVLTRRIVEFEPHLVMHLAAIHFIPYCLEHPAETFASNVRGSDVLVRAATLAPTVRRLVVASTMDVYAPSDVKHRESDVPSPRNVYGMSKLLTETVVKYAVETTERISGVCLRFANVYGPRETNPHLIPDVLDRIAERQAPTIRMGNLRGSRDFIHVNDVADAIVMFASEAPGGFDVFNLGSGIATPVRSVVERLRDAAGDRRPIEEDESKFRKFDRKSLTPDIAKVLQLTSWRPRIPLDDGLRALVESDLEGRRAMVNG